jgi:hypothetical protein
VERLDGACRRNEGGPEVNSNLLCSGFRSCDAVESVKQHIGATLYPIVLEARKPIQSTVFAAMGIAPGEVSIDPA